jgi:hypothetical protein
VEAAKIVHKLQQKKANSTNNSPLRIFTSFQRYPDPLDEDVVRHVVHHRVLGAYSSH